MNLPKAVSQAEWLVARKKLLAKEKESTRQRDALSAECCKLLIVKIEKGYNYQDTAALARAGEISFTKRELPGLSVFLRVGDSIFHTYSTYQRGLDLNFHDKYPA